MILKRIAGSVKLAFCLSALCSTAALSSQATVTLPPDVITLPPVSAALQATEAKPTPQEFALAQALRPLLDDSRYNQALELLSQRAELSPALSLVKAQLLAQQNQFAEALATYDDVLKEMPELMQAHQGRAIILLLQKRYEAAQHALTKAIQLGLNDIDAYTQLAYINLQANDAWSALSAFQHALMLDPDSTSLRFGLLSALVKTGQTHSALNLIASLLELEPENTGLWLQRANLALSMDDINMALSSLETAIRLGDKEPGNYIMTAQFHLQKGNFTRANDLLSGSVRFEQQQIVQLLPMLVRFEQWQLLETLLQSYQPELEQLVGIEKSRFHLYQAQLAKINNQPKQVTQALTAALQADPANGKALLELAGVYLEDKNYTAAEHYYARATVLDTVKQQGYLGLAQTFLAQLNYDAALENLVALSKLDPHNKDIQHNINGLKRILLAQQ